MPTNNSFIEIGATSNNFQLQIPFPNIGSAFETTRLIDGGRNANGVLVGQEIGRSIAKQSMGWNVISCAKWWEINRFVEQNGMFFYCRYFDHCLGSVKVRKFYCGDFKCEPYMVDKATGIPKFYINATFNVIDTGA